MSSRLNLLIALFLIFLSFPTPVKGTPESGTPESRAAVLFLLIEPSARSFGMGETGTALANDGAGAYFNPAGLGNLDRIAGELSTRQWLRRLANDMRYSYGAIAFKSNTRE